MKKVLLTLILGLSIIAGPTFASFPIVIDDKKEKTEQASDNINNPTEERGEVIVNDTKKNETVNQVKDEKTPNMGDEKLITILLWVLLWPLAAHRWYKKKPVGWNILFILTGGGCGVWALVDIINILTDNF